MTKSEFITAYCYSYGSTKKEAEKVYKAATPAYIAAVIESRRHDVKAAMYED